MCAILRTRELLRQAFVQRVDGIAGTVRLTRLPALTRQSSYSILFLGRD